MRYKMKLTLGTLISLILGRDVVIKNEYSQGTYRISKGKNNYITKG